MIRKLDGFFFCWTSNWFLFSHTTCIFKSINDYTFKTKDTNLSLLFLYVSLVLFSIQSKGIKRWGKKTRFRIVLNSNQETSNCSFAFGFWSFGDLVPLFFLSFLCPLFLFLSPVSYLWVEIRSPWALVVLPDVCSLRADVQPREGLCLNCQITLSSAATSSAPMGCCHIQLYWFLHSCGQAVVSVSCTSWLGFIIWIFW